MNTIIVGAYWGDEGKGKVVDLLAADSDWVVRYNGGDNAGHTLVVEGKKVVLHVIPAGVLQGKNVLIGPDVFFNPLTFIKDLKHVEDSGFKFTGKILIDERAHVIMPYHISLDGAREEKSKIGTTKRGIGPAAEDKASRTRDITIYDMTGKEFYKRITEVVEERKEELLSKKIIQTKYEVEKYCEKIFDEYSDYASRISKYVGNGSVIINSEIKKGKRVLLEGAQGTLLDVVHGTRPFVTSSNTTAGGAAANMGVDIRGFRIMAIVKAYPTRVGEGPFPTELGTYEEAKKEIKVSELTMEEKRKAAEGNEYLLGKAIRIDGAEYGATTGRPRRTGNPDFVALKYAAMINGVDEWIITKIDVLGGKSFKAAIAYKKNTVITGDFPFKLEGWKPVYGKEYFLEQMSEQQCIEAVKKGYDSLPSGIKRYVKDLVTFTGVPVGMISLSPKREITLTKDVLKRTREYLKK